MNVIQFRRWFRYVGLWGVSRLYPNVVPAVLMYHSIHENASHFFTVSPERFRSQLQYLVDHGHQFVTLDTIALWFSHGTKLPERAVCVTFDDGYQDNLTTALPILEAFQCPAIVYVVTDFVKNGGRTTNIPICSQRELRELAAHSLITIGGHTKTHPKLSKLSEREARAEIHEAKKQLEDWLRQTVRHFAYPYGDFSEHTIALVKESGFHTAVTVRPEHVYVQRNPFTIGRIPVDSSLPSSLFYTCCTEGMTRYVNIKQSVGRKA
ncbi:MAG: polysaccharide deacetylase family protein [bacterium]|nr:polysaccharide deacetylase family protein [bacterium]